GSQPTLSDRNCDEAAVFTSSCGPRACPPVIGSRRFPGFRRSASDARVSPGAGSLLLGASPLTETGLSPAGSPQHDDGFSPGSPAGLPSSSRRTTTSPYHPYRAELRLGQARA